MKIIGHQNLNMWILVTIFMLKVRKIENIRIISYYLRYLLEIML